MATSPRLLILTVVLVLWGLITHGTYAGTGDEPHYEMIAHSLAFDRDLDLANNYQDPNNLALGSSLEAEAHVRPGKDGRSRPVHDVGMPILFAPYYALVYKITEQIVQDVPASWLQRARLNFTVIVRHFLSLAMIGLTAWIGVLLLDVFTTISTNRTRAFLWAALLVLSPPLLSHGFLFFTEIVSAFVALAVFLWLRTGSNNRAAAFTVGAATGYLLLVHARNVGLVAGLLVIAIHRLPRLTEGRRLLTVFLSGALALFLVRAAVTFHLWGTWLTTPQATLDFAASVQPESMIRLAGWFFDQEHGLLPYAPIFLLLPAGWFALWKRSRDLCIESAIVVASYVAVMMVPIFNAHGWRGGWSPAARFLVPVAPWLAILVFSAVGYLQRLPAIVICLVALQVCLDAVVWQHPKLLWNDGTGTSALLAYIDQGSGWLSSYGPRLVSPIDFRTTASIGSIIIVSAFITRFVTRSVRDGKAVRWSATQSST